MIKVANLQYQYPKGTDFAIKDVNFEVKQGEIFGFLGPSGAGKSTTQKIVIGSLKGYQGSVQVMGAEVGTMGSNLYEKIGVSFELPNLYSKFTALENLQFFASLYAGKTANPLDLLALVGLKEAANSRVGRISKGMKMRLNFCRALLNESELLFFDEPTSGLDPVNAKNIKNIIFDQKRQGRTVFLTTHNMNVAEELCDRVAFIVDGQIALIDSPKELKLQQGKKMVTVHTSQDTIVKSQEFSLEGLADNQEFLTLLRSQQVQTIHTQEATLEDIFIRVTGRTLI